MEACFNHKSVVLKRRRFDFLNSLFYEGYMSFWTLIASLTAFLAFEREPQPFHIPNYKNVTVVFRFFYLTIASAFSN